MPSLKRVNNPAQGGLWGIMGGTFNPVHYGHLIMAETVQNSLHADGMLFIPARDHPFKADQELSNYDERCQMLNMAVNSNDRFLIEEPPENMPYTFDLVEYLRGRYPHAELFLVIGSDIIHEFSSWYKHEELEDSIRIVIAARPGFELNAHKNSVALRSAERIMIPQLDISSSEIRRRVKAGLSIRYLLPDTVEKFIRENSLYVG